MNEKKLLELSKILYQASLLQLECQDKKHMHGIEGLRCVYHGVTIELENTLLGKGSDDWRELIQSRISRAFNDENYAKQFMAKARKNAELLKQSISRQTC